MSKCTLANSCVTCLHYDHKGGFGEVAYIPKCRLNGQELPWTPGLQGNRGRIVARGTGVIPEWCPLPARVEQPVTLSDKAIAVAALQSELDKLEEAQLEMGQLMTEFINKQQAMAERACAITKAMRSILNER